MTTRRDLYSDAAAVLLSVHLSLADAAGDPTARGTILYVFVHDVDALHGRLVDAGVEIHSPLETLDYGMREFEVVDPDGHRLVFGQGVSGSS